MFFALMLAFEAPPDTSSYMIAGYAVIFAALVIYLVSLIIRQKNLKQDLETLEELEKKDSPTGASTSSQYPAV